MTSRAVAALSVLALVLALPAGAAAATRTVDLSPPPSAGKSFQKLGADANAFFPSTTTLHVGDRITFRNNGFHNVNVLRRGGAQPLFIPAGTIAGSLDAAGTPFWFNGQPNVQFNPAIFIPGGPNKVTFDGTKPVFSKVPAAGPPKPFTVKFAKTGTYALLCSVHPGMKGRVIVLGARRRVPSAKAHAAAATRQVKADVATAKKLLKSRSPRNVVNVGESGRGGVESFAMYPATLSVAKGTTVRFQMSVRTFEVHTATFGPGNPLRQPRSYLGRLAGSFSSPVVDEAALYPSDPPTGVAALTKASHGNGFWNSGVLDRGKSTPPPASARVTFAQAGTFTYYCLIHPFMKGTVKVR